MGRSSIVLVHDVRSPSIVPVEITTLIDLVGAAEDSSARTFQQFQSSQTPLEVAGVLQHLSAALFDINQAFEDEAPALLASKADVTKLVTTIERLVLYVTRGEGGLGAVSLLFPTNLPQQPTVARWAVGSAAVFAQGVALADYYRILERDKMYSSSLVAAIGTLHLLATGDGPKVADFSAAEKLASSADAHPALLDHASYRLFVRSSMTSPELVLRRRASMFEELVALHPTFAPLRLHYIATVLFDLRSVTIGGRNRYALVGELIDREKQAGGGKRQGKDVGHDAILDVLQLYSASLASGEDSKGVSSETVASAFQALKRIVALPVMQGIPLAVKPSSMCSALLAKPWIATPSTVKDDWLSVVGGTRPDLLHPESVASLLHVAATALHQRLGDAAQNALTECL